MPAPTLAKLDFTDKLIQSGRKENTEAVLKRIKTLHQKLSMLEQETTDINSLKPICKQLVSELILHHKDRGVKAYAACCLADSLRICAPDAPYTMDQLRDIFQFFSVQLTTNLKPPAQNARLPPLARNKSVGDSQFQSQPQLHTQASQRVAEIAYYNEYCYLLESLATIKSASLACDVPDSDEILAGFFDGFIEVVRPDMSKNVIRHMTEILVCLIDEATAVPAAVMDCIIGQFVDFASKPETPSFQMIVDVCNKTAEKLNRPIYAHFSAIQLEHGRNPSQDDLKALSESHALLLNMFRFSPGLLLNVVPLLEANLKAADEVPLRALSTKSLGKMFGERPVVGAGRADLAKAYPSAWRAWLGRKVDKHITVRLAWVESTRGILCNHPELRRELEGELVDRIHDADERVRAAICKVIGTLDFETALHHISEETLRAVGGRISDKKGAVRSEAATALGKLWSMAYALIDSNDADVVAQFAWIPDMMLLSLLKRDVTTELRTQITHIFKTVILPLPENKSDVDAHAWVDRLLLVSTHLSTPGFNALKRLAGLTGYARGGSPYRAFVEFCEANNGGVIDQDEEKVKARLEYVISAMAQAHFVDIEKAKKDMNTFAAVNEQRLYRLYRHCVDIQTDLQTLVKSRAELRRRLEQHHTEILETFTTIIDHGAWNIINQTSITPLIAVLQKRPKGERGKLTAGAAREWLRLIAKEGAPMFKSHVAELGLIMGDKKNEALAEAGLQAFAAVCKVDEEVSPSDAKILEKAHKIAIDGTPKQAKYATRILAHSKNPEAVCRDLVEALLPILNVKNKNLVSHLSALSELALSCPDAFETKAEQIIAFALGKVVNAVSPSADVELEDVDDPWVEESELEMLDRAKLVSLRICTHRALGLARADDGLAIAGEVLGLLASTVDRAGTVNENTNEGPHTKVHMRLRAALCLIKLAKVRDFDRAMSSSFETIATMAMEPCFEARQKFLVKLSEVLPAQRLLPRWNAIPALSAVDPNPENILLAKSIMVNNIRACGHMSSENQIERIQMPLARLILIVSHLPDMEWDLEGMKKSARFIELYLECVATKDTISLLYYAVGRIKTVRDIRNEPFSLNFENTGLTEEERKAPTPEQYKKITETARSQDPNANLYALSELAQLIIQNKAAQHSWTITSYIPKDSKGKSLVRMPRDVFHNLTDPNQVSLAVKIKYLDDEIANHVKNLGRRTLGPALASKRVTERTSPVKRSKPSTSTKKPRKKARRSRDDDNDEDESDESSDEEEDDEDEAEEEMQREEEDVDMVGNVIEGRGGRRGAKTKAKKAVSKKTKGKKRSESKSGESDLTDLDDE